MNGVKTSYTWDGAQLVSQNTTGGDTLYFIYHGNSRVAVEYKGNTYYYIYNLQGDVVGLVNSSGTSVVSYTYDAWGNPESITGSMASTLGAANPFRYRSYYFDTESGLYYLMSRYYDPVVGRFLNADGILAANGDLLSFNLFTYCSNNPTNLADPAGDIAISTIILIGAVVGGLIAEGFSPENRERANNLINDPNPYNVGNWLTLGAFDTVKGAVQPEEPLSAQHWLDSAATATMIMVPASKLAARDPFQGLKNKLFKTPNNSSLVPSACFIAGTQIRVEDGFCDIENVKMGDLVWAKDPISGEVSLKKVIQTFERESFDLIHIVVNGETITTTPEHPFYRPSFGWTSAVDLRAGDELCMLSGELVIIETVQHEILETPVKVFNFEVEDFHTYYVGSSSILVHNTCMRFTGDQQALLELGKEARLGTRVGRFMTFEEAMIIDEWALEYGIPQHHGALIGSGQHWALGWDHTHLFGEHIPFK